jgi:hypothetical protein
MTTAYTSLLGLALPVTGELSGTWGDTVNNYITQYLDASVAGTNTLSTDADVTLVKTTNASLSGTSSQYAVILWTAGGTATRTIIAPSASSGSRQFYIVVNKTSSTQSIKLCGTGPTTGVTIAAGYAAICVWNGSDFIQVAGNTLVNLTSGVTGVLPTANGGTGGTLPVTNGGTGSTTLTANYVLLGNGTGALQVVAPSTSGNVLTSNGTTWASSSPGGIGTGQTWTDVSGSRAADTTYTNSTGKPIYVLAGGHCQPSQQYKLTLNGTATNIGNSMGGAMSGDGYIGFIVPAGNTYLISPNGSGANVGGSYGWWELR